MFQVRQLVLLTCLWAGCLNTYSASVMSQEGVNFKMELASVMHLVQF